MQKTQKFNIEMKKHTENESIEMKDLEKSEQDNKGRKLFLSYLLLLLLVLILYLVYTLFNIHDIHWEIIFWSLFGTLTYGLWNIQTWIRRSDANFSNYQYWYISKIIIGPIIAFVIMLFLMNTKIGDLGLSSEPDYDITKGLSFILGYYGNAARQYLDIIRNKYFPGESKLRMAIMIDEPKNEIFHTSEKYVKVKGKAHGEGIKSLIIQLNKKDKEENEEIYVGNDGVFETLIELEESKETKIRISLTNEEGKTLTKKIIATYQKPNT